MNTQKLDFPQEIEKTLRKRIKQSSENINHKDDFKYYINLYKRYGEKLFINRENSVYRRNTKLLN